MSSLPMCAPEAPSHASEKWDRETREEGRVRWVTPFEREVLGRTDTGQSRERYDQGEREYHLEICSLRITLVRLTC